MEDGIEPLTKDDAQETEVTTSNPFPLFLIPDFDNSVATNNCASIGLTSNENLNPLSEDHFAYRRNGSNNHDELIKWINYNHFYSLISPYGYATCFVPTDSHIVVGTAKGIIAIFDYKEFIKALLVPATIDDGFESTPRSSVTKLRISKDGNYVCATFSSGDIFLWNLNKTSNGSQGDNSIVPLYAVLNITDHKGCELSGIDFYAERHTGILVANKTTGAVTLHSGHRNSFWKLSYKSTLILNISKNEKILSMKAHNYGNMAYVAILTSRTFAIIRCTEKNEIVMSIPISAPNQQLGVNYSISWSFDAYKIVFSLNNFVEVIAFSDFNLSSIKSRYNWITTESICFSKWISSNLVGILTISHQFDIILPTSEHTTIANIDLLEQEIVQPPSSHFEFINSRILIFSSYCFKEGKIRSWSEMILNCVQKGDYIHALLLIEYFLTDKASLSNLLFLEQDDTKRLYQLSDPFKNLTLAAVGYLTNLEDIKEENLVELFYLVLRIVNIFANHSHVSNDFEAFIDELYHRLDNEQKHIFCDVISNTVKEGNLKKLPPECFKDLISYLAKRENGYDLGEILTQLDPDTLDIDLATKICENNKLFDILIYIWNKLFNDYVTPLLDFFFIISDHTNECVVLKGGYIDKKKVFDYLQSILTGIQFPVKGKIFPEALKNKAISDILAILLSGVSIEWPPSSGNKLILYSSIDEPPYPYLSLLLNFDVDRCLRLINKIFESSLPDEEETFNGIEQPLISRQNIVEILVDYMKCNTDAYNQESVAVFIAYNYSKFPQYVKLSNRIIELIVRILCEHTAVDTNKVQLGLESLISTYTPPDRNIFVALLVSKGFNDVLLQYYRIVNDTPSIIKLITSSNELMTRYRDSLLDILQKAFTREEYNSLEILKLKSIIEDNFERITENVDLQSFVTLLTGIDVSLHKSILKVNDSALRYKYLDELFKTEYNVETDVCLLHSYISLSSRLGEENNIVLVIKRLKKWPQELDDLVEEFYSSNYYNVLSEYFCLIGDIYAQLNSVLDLVLNNKDLERSYLRLQIRKSIEITSKVMNNEKYWVKIISTLLTLYSKKANNQEVDNLDEIQNILLNVLVKMSEGNITDKVEGNDIFSKILAESLENQEILLRRFNDYNLLFQNIFRLYGLNEIILSLTLDIILKFSAADDKKYLVLLKEGWTLSSDCCEVCGKKIWGLGLDKKFFELWKQKNDTINFLQIDVKSKDLIIFKCKHTFHRDCLGGVCPKEDFHCIICEK